MAAVKAAREGFHSITPYVVAQGAGKLIDFVKQAFGAEEIFRMARPDGERIRQFLLANIGKAVTSIQVRDAAGIGVSEWARRVRSARFLTCINEEAL
jgi:hypothetical protein